MARSARYLVIVACCVAAAPARADTAAEARGAVARFIEDSLASEEPKSSPFLRGITGYRIDKVTVDEKQVHVTVAFRTIYWAHICGGYYRPARWHAITFDLDRSALGSPHKVRSQMNIQILGRKRVAQIECATLYYVIAGCFRSEKRAKQHAAWASPLIEYGFTVLRSSDYAGLRLGYFIVVQVCGFWWQTEDLAEARSLAAMYRKQGIACYIKRIPPLKRRQAPARGALPPR